MNLWSLGPAQTPLNPLQRSASTRGMFDFLVALVSPFASTGTLSALSPRCRPAASLQVSLGSALIQTAMEAIF